MLYTAQMVHTKVDSVKCLFSLLDVGEHVRAGVQKFPDTNPRAMYPVGEVFTRTPYCSRTVARSR